MTDKQVYDLTKYLFESWERGADYDNYHTDSMCVLEALAQPERDPWREAVAQPDERNFCPRCGKRTADLTTIHTCTPPTGV